ncbi:transcriptional regulator domain-containing protein [Sphingomonas sp. CJ99]
MPRSANKRTSGSEKTADTLGRAELAAEFLKRNHNYRAEHAQMEQRIARGSIARQAAEAEFARRWGLSFRLCAG